MDGNAARVSGARGAVACGVRAAQNTRRTRTATATRAGTDFLPSRGRAFLPAHIFLLLLREELLPDPAVPNYT
jgi:hypothetical protein